MYPLTPLKVFIHERVHEKPHWIARARRVIAACANRPEVETVADASLPQAVEQLRTLWPPESVPAGCERTYMRPLVFSVQDLSEDGADLSSQVERCGGKDSASFVSALLGGFRPVHAYHKRSDDQKENHVCWPTFDFKTMVGCPHGCQYCTQGKGGKYVALGVNIEEFVETVVPRTVAEHSFQKCFRLIGWQAEQISFEPEYGAFDLFTRKLADLDRYLYFHTAGTNVGWIASLPRRDRLIGVFSVTCDAVARRIEPGAGDAFGRFDAGGALNALGVPVRPKFKPIIPIRNWREETARAIEEMFARCRPESVGLCVIMWMNLEKLTSKIAPELLDEECLAAAQEATESMRDVRTGPFPHDTRREIYRHFIREIRKWDKEVPIYVSTESREMWDDLHEELGQKPCSFFCGCGPVALPGRKLALSKDFKYSTYSPHAGDPVAALAG